MSLNQASLIGNLGAAPELKQMPDKRFAARMSVATTHKWKDRQSGETKEKTEWHRVVAYGPLAEVMGEYGAKGRQIFVQGQLRTREYDDKDGNKRWSTEIVASNIQLLGPKPADGKEPPAGSLPAGDDLDDDIPF